MQRDILGPYWGAARGREQLKIKELPSPLLGYRNHCLPTPCSLRGVGMPTPSPLLPAHLAGMEQHICLAQPPALGPAVGAGATPWLGSPAWG